MAKVYTDSQDELTIVNVLKHGLRQPALPKWTVLRIALAKSLRISTPPDDALDRRQSSAGGGEYSLEQLAGEHKSEEEDVSQLFKALLSEYHDQDLFSDEDNFVRFLQRHVRRGLREFRSGWMESHDFHDYLLHELFGDLSKATSSDGNLNARLGKALAEIGVSAEITDSIDGPRLSRYLVRLRDANDHGPLLRGLEKIGFILGLGEMGIFSSSTTEPRIVALDIPRQSQLWRSVSAPTLLRWLADTPSDWRLPVYLGQNVVGEPFGFDLAAAPHLLLAGTTGSGKSVCIHALILSLIGKQKPSQLNLVLIDTKKIELSPYAKLPHLSGGILTEVTEILTKLDEIVNEMEQREDAFASLGIRDIDDPRAPVTKFPRIVVVVEEMADLLIQSPNIEERLIRLAQKARATGIHLILATQRPDAKTFSGLLRSNIPSRIALTVQKASESKIILDETGAEKLLGKGDMLVRLLGEPTVRLHGVLINSDDISQAVSATGKRKR